MSNLTTIARPYAKAAFEYALQKNAVPMWEEMLCSAASLIEQRSLAGLLSSPEIAKTKIADLFCDVLSSVLDAEKRNFIRLLAENGRLPILPEIANLFANYRAEQEKNMTVQVISAITLDEQYQHKLAASLTTWLKRKISLQCTLDPTLLGGIVVRAGGRVIDGSVRGKLNRLYESL
ncbi:MAG: atpH [Gammaproteobacteria bacterium]|jgi:F-type H+-transporting ATPase subunit delta|nr:atpH [Gammaproteobacteria bacterium]